MSELPAPAGHVGPQQQLQPFVPSQQDYEFEVFYTREMHRVSLFLMNLGASLYEAADATHEAFVVLLPDKWRTLEYPGAYLRVTAYRFYLRQTNNRLVPTDPVPDRPGGTCPVELVILTAEQQRMLDALRALPPAEREAMAWSLDGFSHEETAAALGKKPVAVRKAYQRARERLLVHLGLKKEATTHE
ncbi:RNA polymerase sigma factor [Streptomyces sp. NPDC060048]|uniref:RNA polymerase sigma factor n=1 Tax=unclassified Streptomyces TaxID=2593676 RepID=UPI00367E4CB2